MQILPFDKIKIDKSFISRIELDPEALKIVKAIIGLATSLDLPVVAEGVETLAVADLLWELGCAQGQGYLFGRAQPAEQARLLSNLYRPPDVRQIAPPSKARPARVRKG